MTKFRVLKTSYIQDGLHEPGDIVDIDPDTVNPEDDNLERIEEKKAPAAKVPPTHLAEAPVAAKPVAEVAPSTKHDDDKKAPAKPDVSPPKAVIVSPDGKETLIAKPAPEKPTSGKP